MKKNQTKKQKWNNEIIIIKRKPKQTRISLQKR